MYSNISIRLIAIIMIGLISCKKKIDIIEPVEIVNRTVLIYVAANNNLKDNAIQSINKMEQGVRGINGNLIVFVKINNNNSVLLKIKYDNSSKIVSDTIKVYGNRNSSDPSFLKEVIADSRKFSPARTYGLVMWSHATSWSPPFATTESFGSDEYKEMDIRSFREAIPSDFQYILFDACSMGSMEVVYELKDKARYLLTSPSEVLATSFPYDKITPSLFGNSDDLKKVCEQFIGFYSSLPGASASATVSLIKTDELDLLAEYTKKLLDLNTINGGINLKALQKLDFESTSRIPAYDFMSFIENNFDKKQYENIENQIEKTVVFKGHTEYFFNIPIKKFSGLSVYLPDTKNLAYYYYPSLAWYHSSGWNNLF